MSSRSSSAGAVARQAVTEVSDASLGRRRKSLPLVHVAHLDPLADLALLLFDQLITPAMSNIRNTPAMSHESVVPETTMEAEAAAPGETTSTTTQLTFDNLDHAIGAHTSTEATNPTAIVDFQGLTAIAPGVWHATGSSGALGGPSGAQASPTRSHVSLSSQPTPDRFSCTESEEMVSSVATTPDGPARTAPYRRMIRQRPNDHPNAPSSAYASWEPYEHKKRPRDEDQA